MDRPQVVKGTLKFKATAKSKKTTVDLPPTKKKGSETEEPIENE